MHHNCVSENTNLFELHPVSDNFSFSSASYQRFTSHTPLPSPGPSVGTRLLITAKVQVTITVDLVRHNLQIDCDSGIICLHSVLENLAVPELNPGVSAELLEDQLCFVNQSRRDSVYPGICDCLCQICVLWLISHHTAETNGCQMGAHVFLKHGLCLIANWLMWAKNATVQIQNNI